MSNPFYNPYASGNHNPTQGQYGVPNPPTERDPRGASSYLGPGSRFSAFGASPVIPENSGQPGSASLNYRPEPGRAIRDEDAKSSIDMHIGRAREGVRPPSNQLHQPMDQGTRFTSTQREDFRPPGASYTMTSASASLGHKHEVDIGSGSSNLNYIRPPGGSILKSSSALSNYANIPDARFNNPDERGRDMQTIPGLGDYDRPASDKPASSTEPFQPMYTYESASSILLQFGLEKEDLEHLISYPEDQITPANLPFILRQIRLQKDKNAATAAQSKPYLESRPTRTMGSGGAMEKTSSAVLQPSNVIDYGHTSKYTAGVGDDAGMNIDRDNIGGSGNVFLMDTDERHYREPKSTPEFKSSVLGSSKEQMRSSTSLSSMYGSVLRPVDSPSSDQTKPWQVKPQQTFQEILNSFSQLKSDKSALKSEGSKLVPLNQQEVHRQSTTSKAQPPSSQTHGSHPSQPGLLQIGGKTPGQRPTVPVKTHQASQQPIEQKQKQPVKKAPNQSTKQAPKQPVQKQQQSKKQMQQHQKHPASQKGQVASAGVSERPMKPAASKGPQKNKAAASKDQPTPEMMFDYAAASPRIFPHTCVLCNKECTDMKDWIAHQNSSVHLESCTRLRKQFPKWDGGITLQPRPAGKDAKTPSSTSAKKARHGSRSRSKSLSPLRRRSSEGRRDKRRSRSRSPKSSKFSGRYDGPSTSSYRSRSQSPERRSSPRRKDDRQSSPRRTRDRRSPLKRSNESWSPPRRVDNRRSPLRKGDAARSPLRRSSDSRSPTRRVDNRWFDSRRSPLRRVGGRRSPLRRSAESSSPLRRSLDRRPSREGSSDQRKGSNSAESLAKKLLETSAVQSLSNKSDLETVVKTLAPALLAELAKMTTPASAAASSSSSSLKGGKRSLPAFSTRRKKLSSSASSSTSSSSTAKMKRSATIPSKAKSLLKSEVRLRGIHEGISHDDVVTAMEHFGKTKSVTLYRSKLEAIARFEKEEDANRLKILQVLDVKGAKVTVVEEKAAVKKQTKAPLKKPTKTTASWKVLLPTPKIPPLIPSLSSGSYQSTFKKFVSTKAGAKNSAKAMKTVNKAQVLVSKAKNVSTKVVAKNVKTAKLPVKEGEKTAAAKQETSSPENQPDAADSKEKVVPESAATSSEGVGVEEVDESANKTAGEAAEAPSTGGTVLVSQAATGESVPSKSADSDNQPLGESLKRNEPEAKVAESSEVHKDTAESGKASPPTVVKLQGIGSALSHSDVLAAVKHFGKTKSVILVRARLEAVVIFEKEEDAKKLKSMKSLNVNGTEITVVPEKESISKEEKTPPLSASTSAPSTLKPAKEDVKATAAKDANTPTKSTADDQSDGEKSKPQEPNVKAEESLQVSEDAAQAAVRANVAVVKLEDAADDDEGEPMEIEVSGVKDEVPETGAESSVESTVTLGGGAETQTTQEERTQMDSTSADEVSIEVQPAVKTEPVAAASKQSATGLTIGEMLEKRLFPKHINAWLPDYSCQNLPYGCIHVLISGLPMHCPGVYTETDVANLLRPFGFKRKEDNLFVFAQSRMAFAMMPTVANVLHLTRTSAKRGVFFRGTRLVCQVIKMRFPLTAAQFYTNLKRLLRCSTSGEVERTVLIRNISQRDIRELREGLKRFGPVTNFTPLLNKLFVEFESVKDVDRFEGWYGVVNKTCGNKVVKLKGPSTTCEVLRNSVQEFEVEGDFGIIYDPPPRMYAEAASADDASMTDGTEEASVQQAGETDADTTEGVAEAGTASSRSEASEKPPDLGDLELKIESAGAGLQEETQKRQTPAAASSEGVSSSECEASDSVPGAAIKGPGVQLKDPEEAETVSKAQEAKSQVVTLAEARGANEDELVELGAPGDTEQTGPSSSRDTGTEAPREDAAVEAETETTKKESTQTDSTPTRESSPSVGRVSTAACTEVASPSKSEAAAAAASRPPSSSPSSTRLTIGEMLQDYLFANDIHTLQSPYISPLAFNQQLLIRGLPPYHDGCYTEDDVADLLFPFGFRHKQDKLYVIPQTRMAFATMPSLASVYNVLKVHRKSGLYFREKRLSVQIVRHRYQMKLFQFYRFLKTVMKCSKPDEAQRTILIRNISPSEIRELRDALKEFGPLTNFMPLLNKLFVEFESVEDTDRFGGWYSELLQTPGQEVIRLKKRGPATTQPHAASAKGEKKTFGEKFENYLSRKKIGSLKCKPGTTPKMLISLLPAYGEGSYTESEVIELLAPFGYQHKDHNIYVFPQASLAFVLMPTAGDVSDAIRATRGQHVTFKESELYFSALDDTISMRPFWFYQSLMARLGYCVTEDRDAVIFIRGISPSESRQLRDALAKMGSVRNFLPLLNKVFVEFQSACDADWLGVWYSLLRRAPGYRIQRLKIPLGTSGPPSPVVPKESLLDNEDLIDGVALPSVKVSVPQFSTSPFWISLRHSPFVFPTISPWFVIPEYRTVKNLTDIETAGRQGSMCPTIMLTGLPEGNYRHEDVARLVWPYFPKQTLHSLYYNVTVLPLQRRAFVFFSDWTTCCDFVQAHVAKRVSLKGRILGVHFVLQNMYPESSEETMYRSLMKWSNAGVPDPTSLEERLLCVEVSEVSLDVITLVVEMVASITSFANFMPLANRICIEMSDSSSVSLVVDKYKDPSPNVFTEDPAWSKVKNFEPLDCLRQRLQDSADVTINLDEPDAVAGKIESPDIDEDMLKAITVTLGENRLVQKSRSQSVEKKGQDDFTEDLVSSDAYLFDEEQFNVEDFVTVDEVYDDGEDSSVEPRPCEHSSRERSERQSSGGSSSHRRTQTRSSRNDKSAPSSSSSRSNKSSRSSHSSKPTKSSAKPSSSSVASRASSLPPPAKTLTSPTSGKKTKQSATKSPLKSSSSQREKVVTPAEGSVVPEQVGEGAGDAEGAVAKSDHRVSAEGTAAKCVESETEIDPPQEQEHGLDLNQSPNPEVDLETKKKQKKSQEDEKHTEEVAGGSYQATDSPDGQTDEQMEDCGQDGRSALQTTGSEGGQVGDGDGVTRPGGIGETDDEGVRERDTKGQAEERGGSTDKCLQSEIQERDGKQDSRDPDSDGTDQEAFEILDSIDDQTEVEDDEERAQIPEGDDGPVEDGDEAYEVIDSVGDQPATTESELKQQRPRRGGGRSASREGDGPSRSSGPTSKVAEESLKKQERTVQVPEAQINTDSTAEEMLFQVVDSVEEEHVEEAASRESSGRRRSTRGKKDAAVEAFEILDSVENETADKESPVTRRSTRGKRGRTTEDALNETTQGEDAPTGRRQTASRESRSREKTPKREENAPPKEAKRVRREGEPSEEVATYEVLDSVEDEVLDEQPAPRAKGKRGRPKKQVKAAKKDGGTSEKVAKDAADEEEAMTYRILDSVEDESGDGPPPPSSSDQSGIKGEEDVSKDDAKQEQDRTSLEGSTEKEEEEEEEPVFQIVDSLEDDQVQDELATTDASDGTKTGDETPREEDATLLEASTKSVPEEESLLQSPDGAVTGTPLVKPRGDTAALEREIQQKLPEKEVTASALVNLDEVSDEEEDYPDDREEEEELRKRQAAAKEKRFPKEQEARGGREQERRSRGGGGGRRSRRGKEREDEKEEVDGHEMVTLDEVGADEAKDETPPEEEAQALVTLDEFVDEEAEPIKLEALPLSQEDESVDDLNQEALVTLDEACCDEDEKPAEETLASSKRKHDGDAEEGMNFVIVDEVKDEEKVETPRTRGRAKKRARLTPVRKSTRGKQASSHQAEKEAVDEEPPSSSNDADSSKPSGVGELKAQEAAEEEAGVDEASARPELQPEDETLERRAERGEEDEESRTDSKDVSKERRDADGPEAKRPRSQSPSVPADFKLPEVKPDHPLGKEFVLPGFFCSLCSVFYQHESTAKELHCSSQTHFNNLQKHYRQLQQTAGSSTQ